MCPSFMIAFIANGAKRVTRCGAGETAGSRHGGRFPSHDRSWLDPVAAKAELVSFGIGEHVPADVILADVDRCRAQGK